MKIKTCLFCKKDFEYKTRKKEFCNKVCHGKAYHLAHKRRRSTTSKQFRLNNPRKAKDKHYRERYGITIDQYDQMVKDQNGLCKICYKSSKLHVDHCHSTNRVRGLLCNGCNRGIGFFNDNSMSLENAAMYVKTVGSMVDY